MSRTKNQILSIGVETVFAVSAVLKGDLTLKRTFGMSQRCATHPQ